MLLSDGAGGYLGPALIGTASGPGSLASGDLDRDGRPDLVLGLSGDRIGVLLGNGTGGFRSAATFGSLGPPQGLALADLNADGKLDVVAAQDELSASLVVMLGNGAGGLGAPSALATGPGDAVAVADVNGN